MASQDKGNRCACCGLKKPNRRRKFIAGHPETSRHARRLSHDERLKVQLWRGK